MNVNNKTKNIVLTALFTSLITVSIVFFHIPTGFNGGYIHLGDVFIYLTAVILPTPYAMIAAGLGGALSDGLTGGILWILPTMIIKPIIVFCFSSKSVNIISKRNVIAVFLAGLIGVFGYYLAGAIISGNFLAPMVTLFVEMIQPIASGIIFLIAGYAFDKLRIRDKILIAVK